MRQVTFSSAARSDLDEIHDYIADDNLNAADQLLDDLEVACEKLGRHPGMGAACDHLIPEMRLVVVRKVYVVFYRLADEDIEIVRIVHGRRDFSKLFDL